jgi:hypothetical protein
MAITANFRIALCQDTILVVPKSSRKAVSALAAADPWQGLKPKSKWAAFWHN